MTPERAQRLAEFIIDHTDYAARGPEHWRDYLALVWAAAPQAPAVPAPPDEKKGELP